MTEPIPVDQAARDEIRTALARTIFVEAGAGSGKTREMVERVLALVAAGVPLSRIVAITFTNDAAAQLREKIRTRLSEAASDPSEAFAGRARDALREIDSAPIHTIHGFARSILAYHPIEAGLPLEIAVRDEIGASVAFDERWREFLDQLLADGCGDPAVERSLVIAVTLGLTVEHLRRAARAFHNNWERVRDIDFPPQDPPSPDLGPVLACIDDLLAHRRNIRPGREPDDAAYQALDAIVPQAASLRSVLALQRSAVDPAARLFADEEAIRALDALAIPALGKLGNKENWQLPQDLSDLRAAAKHASTFVADTLASLRTACLPRLLTALKQFVRDYRDARIADGALEFDDLLLLARDLLAASTEVRARVASRYHCLLIDEFQDTDPVQVEIVALVAAGLGPPGDPAWESLAVPPGRLFFVGDPKQSIYRFRRADIAVYQRARLRFGAPPIGATLSLAQNFRSVPSILAWVNAIFAGLLNDAPRLPADDPAEQVPFARLEPYRDAHPSAPCSVRAFGSRLKAGTADGLRLAEAADVAAAVSLIEAQAASGAWDVRDPESGWRPPRRADIAILVPARTVVPALEEALAAARIPARIESRSLLFDTQEARDLIAVLGAIEDPTDEVALVAALRSPVFGCSDADLAQFAAAGGRWDYRAPLPAAIDESHPVASALASLASAHERRWWLTPAALLDQVIRESRLLLTAFAGRRPREAWRRIRFIQEQARVFSAGGERSLRQFIRYARQQAEEDARMESALVDEEDDDAVRILTVHAAKGLEYPIVILAGFGSGKNNQPPPVIWGADGRPELRLGSLQRGAFQTPGAAAAIQRDRALDRLERDRLLYVAATRATDHLLVSLHHLAPAKNPGHQPRHAAGKCSAAECLDALCAANPGLWLPLDLRPGLVPATPGAAPTAAVGPTDQAAFTAARRDLLASMSRQPSLAATAIAHAVRPDEMSDEQVQDDAPWRKGRAGTSVGRAVHATLQSIDLQTGEGLAAVAAAQARAEGVEHRLADVLAYARAALASPAVRAAVASGRYFREVYVAATVEGVLIEGFIDLLFETPQGLVIVDYKTDTVDSLAEVDAAMQRHRLQGAAYALALTAAQAQPVAGVTFVFVQPGIDRPVEDLAGAVEAVRAAARGLSASP